jgi:hypothetical protein
MRVLVSQLYEDDGRQVPNWRRTVKPEYEGRLCLDDEYSKELKRHTRCARLMSLSAGDDPLPRLEDAVVVFVRGDVMTVAGFERNELTAKESRQSWYVKILPACPDSPAADQ